MQRKDFCKTFSSHCDKYNQLDKLAHLVKEKSKVVNITSIRDYESIWQKHIVDSLMLSKVGDVEKILKSGSDMNVKPLHVLDIGTGGGFPGLPLAICYPNLKFTLLDSTRKKIEVVKEFSFELGLKNVKAVWGRAEELAKNPKYKGKFDIVTARAVAYLPTLLNSCVSFINESGSILLYKKLDENELKESHKVSKSLGLFLSDKREYIIDGDENKRVIYVFCEKQKSS